MKVSKKILTMIFGITLIMSIALSNTAFAISNGQPDGNEHPFVCWIVSYPGSGEYVWLGTGSLIAPGVVLTAGHVADIGDPGEGAMAWVSFSPTASWPLPYFGGIGTDWVDVEEWFTHPEYALGVSPTLKDWITHDVGVIILDPSVTSSEYALLPTAGLVDTLKMKEDLDLVGYGVQKPRVLYYEGPPFGPPDWDWYDFGYRYNATAQLVKTKDALSDEFMKTTANPAGGKGGTCFGDSGGPILLAGTNTVLGVCSWGTNYNCAGVGYQQRIDIPEILSWIIPFLPT